MDNTQAAQNDPLLSRLRAADSQLAHSFADVPDPGLYPDRIHRLHQEAQDASDRAADALTTAHDAVRAADQKAVDYRKAYERYLLDGGRKPKVVLPTDVEALKVEAITAAEATVSIAKVKIGSYRAALRTPEVQTEYRDNLRKAVVESREVVVPALEAARAAWGAYRAAFTALHRDLYDNGMATGNQGTRWPGCYEKPTLPETNQALTAAIDAVLNTFGSGRDAVNGSWILAAEEDLAKEFPEWLRQDMASSGPYSDTGEECYRIELKDKASGVQQQYFSAAGDLSTEEARTKLGGGRRNGSA